MEGNARQVLPMAKALKKLGHKVTTYNASKWDYGYASRYPDAKVLADIDWGAEEETYSHFVNHIKEHHYDLIIPMNDDAAIMMARHKHAITEYSQVAVNNWDVFKIAMDKLSTMSVCMENDIPCPRTVTDIKDFLDNEARFKFPVVVKPRTGCGAVGFHVADNKDDLISYYSLATEKFGPCLIQEYIPQTDLQYKAEIYIDREGVVKSAVVFAKVRWYPVNGGSSTLNETVDRPDIVESCENLLRNIGWRGYADIDLIQDPRDNTAKIIEINPRITGSVKICFKAGVDFALQITEDATGNAVTPMIDYKKGIYLRYFQKDILWFLKSPNRFSAKPSWFSFKNNTDQIFSFDDPMPFLLSSIEGFSKLRKDSKKRSIAK